MGTLYIVPTPIGNLEDITLRALRVLREAVLIAAEDTRTSRVLLDHYSITTPMTSYHEHNKLAKLDAIVSALDGGDVALISDAGTPGISDPGYELVREAIARGVPVVPLPGANAVISALVGSGLPTDGFVFVGFLPKKRAARQALWAALRDERRTLVAYESPHRVAEALADAAEVLGAQRPCCVAREVSKRYETFHRATLGAAAAFFAAEPARGEVTLVVGGAPDDATSWDQPRVRAALAAARDGGASASQAAKDVARASGWAKADVYALFTAGDDDDPA